MKSAKIKPIVAVLLLLTIAFSLSQTYTVRSEELKIDDRALAFIGDVVGLDMTKYTLTASSRNSATPDDFGGLVREYVSYTLMSDEGKTVVTFTYVNNTMVRWSIDTFDASIHYLQKPSSKPLELTKNFLQRYQTHSKVDLTSEINTLDAVTDMKTQNITVGDIQLRISVQDPSINIVWVQTMNGLEFLTGLSVRVRNGVLDTFVDETSLRRVGSAKVNISQEEAVEIAWEQSKTFTTLNISRGDTYELVPFSLNPEPKIVSLQVSNRKDEPFTMYPLWYIRFSAEEIKYGINGVEAGVWADTGELAYAEKIGYLGVVSDPESATTPTMALTNTGTVSPSAEPTNTQTLSENKTNPPLPAFIIALITSILAIAVIATIIILRRKKH